MPAFGHYSVDVANKIKDILDEYPAGAATLREILQNRDDAGGTIQAITHISKSSKKEDERSTGNRTKSTPTSIQDIYGMFDNFITKDLPEVMLFLENIETIELSKLSSTNVLTTLAVARIENIDKIRAQRSKDRGQQRGVDRHDLSIRLERKQDSTVTTSKWIITHFSGTFTGVANTISKCLSQNLDVTNKAMKEDKLFPGVALARARQNLRNAQESVPLVPVTLVDYDYLTSKKKLEKDDDVKAFVTPQTEFGTPATSDANILEVQKGDVIHYERKDGKIASFASNAAGAGGAVPPEKIGVAPKTKGAARKGGWGKSGPPSAAKSSANVLTSTKESVPMLET
ncbi:hypothetical protein FRC00_002640 [Tulasnella sp. 408]|nr:hypothetical protein FRC00_002640 [Tulasnella sp. 408]